MKIGNCISIVSRMIIGEGGPYPPPGPPLAENPYFSNDAKTNIYYADDAHTERYVTHD